MNKYVQALFPIWVTEMALTGFYHAFGSEEVTILSAILMLVSVVVLPFIAGLRIVRVGGSIGLAVLGGVTISVASVVAVGVSYLITSAGIMAFGGFIIATLMFSVIPQAVFGSLGAIVARKVYAKAT